MGRESALQSKILRDLERMPDTVAFKVVRANIPGVPDIEFIKKGFGAGFIEVKDAERGVVSAAQRHIIKKLNDAGATAVVVRSIGEWLDFRKKLLTEKNDEVM